MSIAFEEDEPVPTEAQVSVFETPLGDFAEITCGYCGHSYTVWATASGLWGSAVDFCEKCDRMFL